MDESETSDRRPESNIPSFYIFSVYASKKDGNTVRIQFTKADHMADALLDEFLPDNSLGGNWYARLPVEAADRAYSINAAPSEDPNQDLAQVVDILRPHLPNIQQILE